MTRLSTLRSDTQVTLVLGVVTLGKELQGQDGKVGSLVFQKALGPPTLVWKRSRKVDLTPNMRDRDQIGSGLSRHYTQVGRWYWKWPIGSLNATCLKEMSIQVFSTNMIKSS